MFSKRQLRSTANMKGIEYSNAEEQGCIGTNKEGYRQAEGEMETEERSCLALNCNEHHTGASLCDYSRF